MYMNSWYKELNRAPWTPPDYVFGIVWSTLYTLMTIALLIVFLDKKLAPSIKTIFSSGKSA